MLGDTIQIRMLQAVAGYGERDDILTVIDTLAIEALISAARAVLYTAAVPTPRNAFTTALNMRDREGADRRARLPLSTEPTSITTSTTPDGTLTKTYFADTTGQANNTLAVASPAQLAAVPVDLGAPALLRGVYRSGAAAGYLSAFTTKDGATLQTSPPIVVQDVRLRTNAPKIAITLYRVLGAAVNGHHVFVNGQPVTARPQPGSALADYLYISFATAEWRDVMVRTSAGVGLIAVAPVYDVVRPDAASGPSLYVIGDSYSDPTIFTDAGTGSGLREEGIGHGLQDYLGVGDTYIDAVGGTGWTIRTAGSQGPNNNFADRWPQLLRANPDVVIVPNGAGNDCYNNVDPQVIATAVRACFAAQRAQNPYTRFIWLDGFTPPYGNYASNATRTLALRPLLLAQLADLGVYYIDTATNRWLYGTGRIGATAGDGPADVYVGSDSLHLTGIGYRAYRQRMVPKVRRILTDDTGALLNTVI